MPDQSLKKYQRLLSIYCMFVMLGSLATLSVILLSPSESANAILFGFSFSRLLMITGLIVVFGFFGVILFKSLRDRAWGIQFAEKWFNKKIIGILAGIGFLLGWIGCFFPVHRMGTLDNYWIRAQPILVLALLACLATLIVFFIVRNKITIRDFTFRDLNLSLPLFITTLIILGGMLITGFGVTSTEDFWYGTGVPILTSQLLVAITGGIIFLYLEPQRVSKRTDFLVCIVIFLVTAYLWFREPLIKSFFFPFLLDPNHAFYPSADAAKFDMASQFPLIGKNIQVVDNIFFERPLYLSFLVYLHLLFGQNYELLEAVQAGVFAILPVLVFLIGRSLNARAVGLGSAIIVMLRGINAIYAANMIDTANPKLMLTDFPAAIGMALVTLFVCEWLKTPERNLYFLVWIGGAIGFTLMLRTNALLLLAFVPLYIFFKLSNEWKRWLLSSGLILLGFIAVTLPWEIRNQSLGGQMYKPIAGKIQGVLEQRYLPKNQTESYLPKNQELTSIFFRNTLIISMLNRNVDMLQEEQSCVTVVCFSSEHFLHNSLTSFLILPTSPMLDDVRYLVKERSSYIWKPDWDGSFTGMTPLFVVINLFLVTTGIVYAWKKKHLQGLTPLVMFIAYNISNGLARTSGGRYIAPIDWILPIYYLVGIFYIIMWVAKTTKVERDLFQKNLLSDNPKHNTRTHLSGILFAFVFLLGFGGLIPFSESLREPRYADTNPIETMEENRLLIEGAGLSFGDFSEFLQNPNASIFIGRSLYPRYYKPNQGEASFGFYSYVPMDFPRTVFSVIGPTGQHSVILQGKRPQYFPHASDIIVLGCKTEHYIDAFLVIILDKEGVLYTHQPPSGLMCPIQ